MTNDKFDGYDTPLLAAQDYFLCLTQDGIPKIDAAHEALQYATLEGWDLSGVTILSIQSAAFSAPFGWYAEDVWDEMSGYTGRYWNAATAEQMSAIRPELETEDEDAVGFRLPERVPGVPSVF